MNQNVFNTEGDFITSPEISQLFGEMIGIWVVMFLEKKNLLDPTVPRTIVEVGPGTGNLQRVVLNTLRQFKLLDNLTVHMVEVSPYLRNLQQQKINDLLLQKDITMEYREDPKGIESLYNKEMNFNIVWHSSYMKYLEMDKEMNALDPHIFLCHEFFDALSSFKFRYENDIWHELLIDNNKAHRLPNDKMLKVEDEHIFKETLSAPEPQSVRLYLKPEHRFCNTEIKNGQEIEVCPLGEITRCHDSQHDRPENRTDRRGWVAHRLRRKVDVY